MCPSRKCRIYVLYLLLATSLCKSEAANKTAEVGSSLNKNDSNNTVAVAKNLPVNNEDSKNNESSASEIEKTQRDSSALIEQPLAVNSKKVNDTSVGKTGAVKPSETNDSSASEIRKTQRDSSALIEQPLPVNSKKVNDTSVGKTGAVKPSETNESIVPEMRKKQRDSLAVIKQSLAVNSEKMNDSNVGITYAIKSSETNDIKANKVPKSSLVKENGAESNNSISSAFETPLQIPEVLQDSLSKENNVKLKNSAKIEIKEHKTSQNISAKENNFDSPNSEVQLEENLGKDPPAHKINDTKSPIGLKGNNSEAAASVNSSEIKESLSAKNNIDLKPPEETADKIKIKLPNSENVIKTTDLNHTKKDEMQTSTTKAKTANNSDAASNFDQSAINSTAGSATNTTRSKKLGVRERSFDLSKLLESVGVGVGLGGQGSIGIGVGGSMGVGAQGWVGVGGGASVGVGAQGSVGIGAQGSVGVEGQGSAGVGVIGGSSVESQRPTVVENQGSGSVEAKKPNIDRNLGSVGIGEKGASNAADKKRGSVGIDGQRLVGIGGKGSVGIGGQGSVGLGSQGSAGIGGQGSVGVGGQGSVRIDGGGSVGVGGQGSVGIGGQGSVGIGGQGSVGVGGQGSVGTGGQGLVGIGGGGSIGVGGQGSVGLESLGSVGVGGGGSVGVGGGGSVGVGGQGSVGLGNQGSVGIGGQGSVGVDGQGSVGLGSQGSVGVGGGGSVGIGRQKLNGVGNQGSPGIGVQGSSGISGHRRVDVSGSPLPPVPNKPADYFELLLHELIDRIIILNPLNTNDAAILAQYALQFAGISQKTSFYPQNIIILKDFLKELRLTAWPQPWFSYPIAADLERNGNIIELIFTILGHNPHIEIDILRGLCTRILLANGANYNVELVWKNNFLGGRQNILVPLYKIIDLLANQKKYISTENPDLLIRLLVTIVQSLHHNMDENLYKIVMHIVSRYRHSADHMKVAALLAELIKTIKSGSLKDNAKMRYTRNTWLDVLIDITNRNRHKIRTEISEDLLQDIFAAVNENDVLHGVTRKLDVQRPSPKQIETLSYEWVFYLKNNINTLNPRTRRDSGEIIQWIMRFAGVTDFNAYLPKNRIILQKVLSLMGVRNWPRLWGKVSFQPPAVMIEILFNLLRNSGIPIDSLRRYVTEFQIFNNKNYEKISNNNKILARAVSELVQNSNSQIITMIRLLTLTISQIQESLELRIRSICDFDLYFKIFFRYQSRFTGPPKGLIDLFFNYMREYVYYHTSHYNPETFTYNQALRRNTLFLVELVNKADVKIDASLLRNVVNVVDKLEPGLSRLIVLQQPTNQVLLPPPVNSIGVFVTTLIRDIKINSNVPNLKVAALIQYVLQVIGINNMNAHRADISAILGNILRESRLDHWPYQWTSSTPWQGINKANLIEILFGILSRNPSTSQFVTAKSHIMRLYELNTAPRLRIPNNPKVTETLLQIIIALQGHNIVEIKQVEDTRIIPLFTELLNPRFNQQSIDLIATHILITFYKTMGMPQYSTIINLLWHLAYQLRIESIHPIQQQQIVLKVLLEIMKQYGPSISYKINLNSLQLLLNLISMKTLNSPEIFDAQSHQLFKNVIKYIPDTNPFIRYTIQNILKTLQYRFNRSQRIGNLQVNSGMNYMGIGGNIGSGYQANSGGGLLGSGGPWG